jgi:hypothetical protein
VKPHPIFISHVITSYQKIKFKSSIKKGAIEVLAPSVDPPLTTRDQHSPLSHNNMLGDKVGGVWLKTGVYLENLNRRSISQGV